MENGMLDILLRLESRFDNMENRFMDIKERIDNIQDSINKIGSEISNLEQGQNRVENQFVEIHKQTDNLAEFTTETKQGIEILVRDIHTLTNVTKTNCYDIADLKTDKGL